ncbi:hypothetical protein ABE288_07315 [Bacillus salipaludis]|uniref:hypothetical protein n=1 Tax=Bacillus salipaludis TaxID=2547811 RepID=UPI003D21EDDC
MNDLQVFFNYLNDMYPEVFNVSVDKISLMGNWCYWKDTHPFQNLINSKQSPISIYKGNGTSEIEGYIYDCIWFKTNDKRIHKSVRDFKLEFNPKRLNSQEELYLKDEILPLLRHVGFTRLDFAFDIEEDLSSYIYFDSKSPKKIGKYIGKNGKLETLYIGSKESEWHVCIYNKKQEKMKELRKEEKAKENGIDYIADLTDWEREQLLKRTHWWRVEIRVRRDKADAEISEEEMFQSFHLVKPCFEISNRIQEQALIFFLTIFPEKIQQMNYRTKKRTEDILLNSSEFDLVSVLRLAFVQNQHQLEYQLKDYLSSTSLQEYDIDILYTSDEKRAMKLGENLDVDNLTFSSNYILKLHHKKQEAKQ